MRHLLLSLVGSLLVMSTVSSLAQSDWQTKLKQELPLLGHRNWIVIADSAYPWQTAQGIETINTGATQLDVLKAVFDALSHVEHVKPNIYLDAEMAHVPESDANGITAY